MWIVTKRTKDLSRFFIPYERSFSLVFWEEWLVGGDPFYLTFWVSSSAGACLNEPPPELQRLALNFLATFYFIFLVVTMAVCSCHLGPLFSGDHFYYSPYGKNTTLNHPHTSARSQKIFPLPNMRLLSIRESPDRGLCNNWATCKFSNGPKLHSISLTEWLAAVHSIFARFKVHVKAPV